MTCPECKGKLIRKRMGIYEGCVGAIALELVFWTVAGIVAIFIHMYVGSTVIFLITFIILITLAHYLDKKYSVLKCESCGAEFKISELKK